MAGKLSRLICSPRFLFSSRSPFLLTRQTDRISLAKLSTSSSSTPLGNSQQFNDIGNTVILNTMIIIASPFMLEKILYSQNVCLDHQLIKCILVLINIYSSVSLYLSLIRSSGFESTQVKWWWWQVKHIIHFQIYSSFIIIIEFYSPSSCSSPNGTTNKL